jgi:two-component system, chemotaxis family, chemotaxis protein CheY
MANILLLEDNHDMLTALKEALELNHHSVIHAHNGKSGLELLASTPVLPDVVLSDLNMPDINGLEFVAHIRGEPEWAAIPTIIMSGYPTDKEAALKTGADAFLVKPFKYHELEAVINRLISPE